MADGSVIIDTELDQSGLKKGLSELSNSLVKGISAAVAAAGTALVGLGAYSIKVGSDFEYAISNVAATMGKTKDDITEISEKAKELGASTKFTATEAAEGFNILAQAGLSATEQLQAIDATLNLAAAGELSMDSAAGYLTTTIKAMASSTREANLSMEDASRVADLYAKGATLAKTSTGEFGEAMSKTAAMAGSYNQSLDTTGAALLALADGGYTGSIAGTYLSRAMSDLYAPTANAAEALDALGVSAYDNEGKSRDLIDVIKDLEKATAGMTEEEKNAAAAQIFTSAGLKAYNTIVSQGTDKLDEFTKSLQNSTGAAQQMAETKLDNLKGDIIILQSATEGFGIAFYEAMSGVGEGTGMMRDFVQEATSIMSDLTDAVNKGGFDGLVNSLGDALARAVSKIIEYVPMLVEGGVKIVSSLTQGLTGSAGTIAEAATSLISTLIDGFYGIMTDLVALGGELVIALCDGLSANAGSIVNSIADGLVDFYSAIAEYIPLLIEAGITLLGALADGIIQALPTLVSAIPKILNTLIEGLKSALPKLIECVSGIILAIVEALPELIMTLVDYLPELVQLIVDTLVEAIPILLEAVISIVMAIVEALPDIIVSLLDVLPTLIQSICDGLMELLPQIIEAGITLFTSLVQELPTIINTIVLALPSIINSIVASLLDMIPLIVDCGVQLLVSLVQALPDIIYAIVNVLPVIIASIISTLVEMIPLLIECGIDLLVSLVKALPQIIITIVAVLPQIINSIIQALIDSIPLIIQCGIDLLTSLIGALPDIIIALVSAIPEIISSIISALLDNIPLLIQSGIDLFVSLIKALPQIIVQLVKAVPEIIKALVNAFKDGVSKFKEVGSNLIKGLWEGIKNVKDWIWGKIKGFFNGIVDGIKDFFGIHSPSTLFENVIGKNLMLGLAEGIADEAQTAIDATQDVADAIADVDFETNAPEVDFDPDDVDFDGMVANVQGVVNAQAGEIGTVVSASAASEHTKGNDTDVQETETTDKNKPQYVENNIYIDGKKSARVLTPYIEKELAWEDK